MRELGQQAREQNLIDARSRANAAMSATGRLGYEIDDQGRALDYGKRAVSIRDNHPTPLLDVPAELCGHGIKLGRKCSICIEDAAPKVFIHTAGELHPAPAIEGRVTFTFNLSDLLDDPAHKPGAELIKLDGTHEDVQAFVFESEGAVDLFWVMGSMISKQLERGKSVTVLILCRGGKHRSVAFGECLAENFAVTATHHHKHLPRVIMLGHECKCGHLVAHHE